MAGSNQRKASSEPPLKFGGHWSIYTHSSVAHFRQGRSKCASKNRSDKYALITKDSKVNAIFTTIKTAIIANECTFLLHYSFLFIHLVRLLRGHLLILYTSLTEDIEFSDGIYFETQLLVCNCCIHSPSSSWFDSLWIFEVKSQR